MPEKNKLNKYLPWLPTLIWMVVIFYLSSRTGQNLHSMFPYVRDFNVGHFIAYFILGLTCYYGLIKTSAVKHPFVWIILISLIYGMSDEFHQSFVPGRDMSLSDLIRDLIGAGLSIAAIILYKKFTGTPKQIVK